MPKSPSIAFTFFNLSGHSVRTRSNTLIKKKMHRSSYIYSWLIEQQIEDTAYAATYIQSSYIGWGRKRLNIVHSFYVNIKRLF
jgi:hypothetical protein